MKKIYFGLIFTFIIVSTTRSQWSLTGNSGTNPPTNFVGTTDLKALYFKVNNSISGLIDYDVNKGNTSVGYQTLLSNTGVYNTAIGFQTLSANTSGGYISAFGFNALKNNTTASSNSAFGWEALYSNTIGYNNVAIGSGTLYNNTSGTYNVASGDFSLTNNTSGAYNSAFGFKALSSNTTGSSSTATGYQSLFSNTYGTYNTANGFEALYSSSTANDNTAVGYHSLYSTTIGSDNTAVGYLALYNSTGGGNDAFGVQALTGNTTGNHNISVGELSFRNNTTGSYNTNVGQSALDGSITGTYITSIGFGTNVSGSNYTNVTLVGNQTQGTASNQVRIGSSGVTSIGGYVGWSNLSDGRVKKNIKSNVPGLAFINKLQPVTYNLDLDEADKITGRQSLKDKDGKPIPISQEELVARKEKEKIVFTGFIAQDIEKTAKALNYDFSGVDAAKSSKDLYGLRYSDFVVPLTKAVQELSAQNDSLKTENQQIQSRLDAVIKRLEALENSKNVGLPQTEFIGDGAKLEQNSPNPFNSNTLIRYYIPQNTTNAQIMITDAGGRVVKNISAAGKGKGEVNLVGGSIASGNYFYTLVVDGKKVDTKQMVILK